MSGKRIFVIGDSHACFWNGRNAIDAKPSVFRGVRVFHVGPATAYNLLFSRTPSSWGSRAIRALEENREQIGCIVTCFGEIDCRVHIVRIAIMDKRSLDEVVEDFVGRYLQYIRLLNDTFGVPVIMWGPVPSTPPFRLSYNPNHPATGSMAERNYVTYRFNELLSRGVKDNSVIAHVSIIDDLIDPTGVTWDGTLYDGVHLSNKHLRPAVAAMKVALHRLAIGELTRCFDYSFPIAPQAELVNIAAVSKYRPSSVYATHQPIPFTGEPNGNFRFHTNKEADPHIIIDFESRYIIDHIVLFNRLGELATRAASVMIACSVDGKEFVPVFCPDEFRVFGGADGNPYTIPVADKRPYRFVKISLREEEYFHLDLVQIFVLSFDMGLPR